MPNNGPILVLHMQDCDLDGPLKNIETPLVVWRDGEFIVTGKAGKKESVYDIGFERVNHEIQRPVLDIDLVNGFNVEPVTPLTMTSSSKPASTED
jgi:hypothetical protein